MSLLEISKDIADNNKKEDSSNFSILTVKCSIKIDLDKFITGPNPSVGWKVQHYGKECEVVKEITDLLNKISDSNKFWVVEPDRYGNSMTVSYYVKYGNMTVPEFAKVVKDTLPVVFNSEEVLSHGILKFSNSGIDYNTITLTPYECRHSQLR